jgi:hypothetical protein
MASRFSTRMYGVGRVYVAVETKCTVPKRITRAWITEVGAPHRTGLGWRVRLGHYAIQFGICEAHPEVAHDDQAFMEHMQMRWVPYTPPEGTDAPLDQGSDEGVGQHEVRPGEPVVVQHDGVVERRGLSVVQPLRVEAGPTGGQEDGPQEGGAKGRGPAHAAAAGRESARVIQIRKAGCPWGEPHACPLANHGMVTH